MFFSFTSHCSTCPHPTSRSRGGVFILAGPTHPHDQHAHLRQADQETTRHQSTVRPMRHFLFLARNTSAICPETKQQHNDHNLIGSKRNSITHVPVRASRRNSPRKAAKRIPGLTEEQEYESLSCLIGGPAEKDGAPFRGGGSLPGWVFAGEASGGRRRCWGISERRVPSVLDSACCGGDLRHVDSKLHYVECNARRPKNETKTI